MEKPSSLQFQSILTGKILHLYTGKCEIKSLLNVSDLFEKRCDKIPRILLFLGKKDKCGSFQAYSKLKYLAKCKALFLTKLNIERNSVYTACVSERYGLSGMGP